MVWFKSWLMASGFHFTTWKGRPTGDRVATPSSIGKPSWPLKEITTELGGLRHLYFHYGVLKFPQGFLRIEFVAWGEWPNRKERPISGPLVFCGCHSPPRKRFLVVTGIADGVTGSTTKCSHFVLKSR